MFFKNKKNSELDFGAKNYQMKDKYKVDQLIVAKLAKVSNRFSDDELNNELNYGPKYLETEQKYIFEAVVNADNKIKYREIFTGFIADDKEECFDLPYVIEPAPFTGYFDNKLREYVPKLSLIWALNDINFKDKAKAKELIK